MNSATIAVQFCQPASHMLNMSFTIASETPPIPYHISTMPIRLFGCLTPKSVSANMRIDATTRSRSMLISTSRFYERRGVRHLPRYMMTGVSRHWAVAD